MLPISSSAANLVPLLASLVLASASSPCYYPDGTYQPNDSPCFPEQAESFCCGQGHSCMSNGLCRWPDSDMPAPLAYVRGSCTDKSWLSGACPQHCGNILKSTWDVIVSCPNNDYCCTPDNDGDQGCCAANTAAPVATASASLTIFGLDVATTVTVIGSAGYTAVGSALTISGTSTTTKPSPQATTVAAKADGSSSRAIIGIGVGAGVGGFVLALVLALCGWTFWKRQRNLPVSRRQQSNSQWQGDEGNALARPIEARKESGAEMFDSSVRFQDGSAWKGAHVGVVERTELDGRARGVELPG